MATTVPVPSELNIRDGNVAENWKKFQTSWTFYEIATGYDKKNEKVRVAALLSVIGHEAVEVYQTFEWESAGDQFKIDHVLDNFTQYCIPRSNVLFETYRFNIRKQEVGESIDMYVTALRRLAASCDFADKERRIRDQIVLGMRDDSVRERILRVPDPDLTKVIALIRASETAEKQSQLMREEKGQPEEVHKVQTYKNKKIGQPQKKNKASATQPQKAKTDKRSHECRRCGNIHEWKKCPAWGEECKKCKGKNHFAKCCTTKTAATQEVVVEKTVYSINGKSKTKTFKVWGTNHKVTFQIDTGAEVNVLPFNKYMEITGDKLGKGLQPDHIMLVTYGGKREKSMGSYQLEVALGGKKHIIEVTVANVKASPLLSRSTSEKMGLVRFIDCDQIPQPVNYVQNVKGVTKDLVLKEYKDVFTGLGNLEGEYKITVDEAVKPVIHAPRRVPVAIRDELKMLLEQMEKDEIIARVTKPTQWVSSLMLKREPNKLRICLDPQDLNRAIQ